MGRVRATQKTHIAGNLEPAENGSDIVNCWVSCTQQNPKRWSRKDSKMAFGLYFGPNDKRNRKGFCSISGKRQKVGKDYMAVLSAIKCITEGKRGSYILFTPKYSLVEDVTIRRKSLDWPVDGSIIAKMLDRSKSAGHFITLKVNPREAPSGSNQLARYVLGCTTKVGEGKAHDEYIRGPLIKKCVFKVDSDNRIMVEPYSPPSPISPSVLADEASDLSGDNLVLEQESQNAVVESVTIEPIAE